MQKIMVLLIAIFFIVGCKEKQNYTIKVHTSSDSNGMAYLLQSKNGQLVPFDSAKWENGYEFKGHIDKPRMVFFSIKGKKNREGFFIDNQNITVKLPNKPTAHALIKGTKLNDIYMRYLDSAMVYKKQNRKLYKSYQKMRAAGNTKGLDSVRQKVEKLMDKEQQFAKSFAAQNMDNQVGLYVIRKKLVYQMSYKNLNDLLQKVTDDNKDNRYYDYLSKHLNKLEKTRIGKEAPVFTMQDTAGREVSLKDFRGNYTLIDFWAAWCGPCRKANPHVVEIYKDFHPKGFQILGVSFDQSKEAWMKAIHDDQLPWTQVSDLRGWKNAAGQLYGINSIPHTVLIDPEGKIVANRFDHKELRKKLEKIYE